NFKVGVQMTSTESALATNLLRRFLAKADEVL
ncbi:MAG: hypothetical protein RLZZ292_3771, partial [Bacteroidota bacterium]